MTWKEITDSEEFQSAKPAVQQEIYRNWVDNDVAEQYANDPDLPYILDYFRSQPMDTGQGVIATTANAAAQNVLGTIPTAIAGVGAMTGSQGMEEFGKGGMEYAAEAFPTNPANPNAAMFGNVIGNVGTMAFGSAGIAKGALALGLAKDAALTTGMAGVLGLGGAMGGVEGAQAADQAGLTGFDRQLGAMIGGAKEIASETMLFGMGAETALARRMLGMAGKKPGGIIRSVFQEAGEEGVGQFGQNVGIRALADDDKQPGLFDDVASSTFWGGVGGGLFGGLNLTLLNGTILPPAAASDVRPVTSEAEIAEGEVPVFHQGKLVGAKPVIQQEEFEPIADLIEGLPPAASAVVESTDIAAKSLDETAKIAPEAVAATSRVVEDLGITDVAEVPVEEVVTEEVVVEPPVEQVEIPYAERPSPNLAPRADFQSPSRPEKRGEERDAWDEQFGMDRRGGRSHNDDGTPYQPTVHDETVAVALASLKGKSDEERIDAIGDQHETTVSNSIKRLLNAGWIWDANSGKMVNPQNPSERPIDFLVGKKQDQEVTAEIAAEKRNKEMFPDQDDFGGKFSTPLQIDKGSYVNNDGIESVNYLNPETGEVDVVISAFGNNDFAAYMRQYDENGNPTNTWTSKLERRTERKGATRAMVEEIQSRLPQDHKYTEDVSVSTDGLRFILNQLNQGYEVSRDENGDVETSSVAISGESIKNDLPIAVDPNGKFDNIRVTTPGDFAKVKSFLAPILERFGAGLSEKNIRWEDGTVFIDIPVLRKTSKSVIEQPKDQEVVDLTDERAIVPPMETPTTATKTTKPEQNDASTITSPATLGEQPSGQASPGVQKTQELEQKGQEGGAAGVQQQEKEAVAKKPLSTPATNRNTEVIAKAAQVLKSGKGTVAEGVKKVIPVVEKVVARDATKPEQMTPEEFVPVGNPVNQGIFKSKKEASVRLSELEETVSKSQQMLGILAEFNLVPSDAYEVAKDPAGRWSLGATHKHRIALAAREKQPVSKAAVDAYGITLPEGYVQDGELYVYRPSGTVEAKPAPPVKPAAEVETPVAGVPETGMQRRQQALDAGLDRRTADAVGAFTDIASMMREVQNRTPEQIKKDWIGYLEEDLEKFKGSAPRAAPESSLFADGQYVRYERQKDGGFKVVADEATWSPPGEKANPQFKKGKVIREFPNVEALFDYVRGESAQTAAQAPTPEPAPPAKPGQRDVTKPEQMNDEALTAYAAFVKMFGNEQRFYSWIRGGGRSLLDLGEKEIQNGEQSGVLVSDKHGARRLVGPRDNSKGSWGGKNLSEEAVQSALATASAIQRKADSGLAGRDYPAYGEASSAKRLQKSETVPSVERQVSGALQKPTRARQESPIYEVKRDSTKAEQMTPEERDETWKQSSAAKEREVASQSVPANELGKIQEAAEAQLSGYLKSLGVVGAGSTVETKAWNRFSNGIRKAISSLSLGQSYPMQRVYSKARHARHVSAEAMNKKPVSAAAVDAYGITLPEGYTRQGDLYVYAPTAPTNAPTETALPQASKEVGPQVSTESRTETVRGKEAVGGELKRDVANKQDAEYLSAVEAGDANTAQRLVNDAALSNATKVTRHTEEKTDTPLDGTYRVDVDGILYRTVTQSDWDRIESQGFLDSDQRNAVSRNEGVNLANNALSSITYAIPGEDSVLLGIKPEGIGLHGYTDDSYIRTWDKIPYDSIIPLGKFIGQETKPSYLADITYDDAGNIIPPSQRFKESSPSPLSILRKSVASELPEKAQNKWTPDVYATAEKYFKSKNLRDLDSLTQPQRDRIQRALYDAFPEQAKAQKDADKAALKQIKEDRKAMDKDATPTPKELSFDPIKPSVYALTGNPAAPLTDEQLKQEIAARKQGKLPNRDIGVYVRLFAGNMVSKGVSMDEARAAMQNEATSIPGVNKDVWIGTSAEFDAEFPGKSPAGAAEAVITTIDGRSVVAIFTDRVEVREADVTNAANNQTTRGVEAVRRLLRHEVFGHRGFSALPVELRQRFFDMMDAGLVPESDLDAIVNAGYRSFADWRTNVASRHALHEEWLAGRMEGAERIPSTGLVARFMDWLSDVWRHITGSTRNEYPTLDELKDTMRAMHKALADLQNRDASGNFQNPSDLANRYSYAGANAQLPQFMQDSLETAKAMAAAGKTSEEIRAITGWFPGKYDGKMRWEIPDDGAKLKDDFGKAKVVSDLIDHPALFDAYPSIAEVPVVFSGFTAGITKDGKTLILPLMTAKFGSDNAALLGGVLHEIQHLIQAIEGFARGGNTEGIYAAEKLAIEKKKAELESIRDAAKVAYEKRVTDANLAAWKAAVDDVWEVMGEKPARRTREEELDYYRRIAGEIESRDIEARKNLTPEQRKAIAPYSSENIAKEDAIVMFDSGATKYALGTAQDAEYLAAVEAGDSGSDNLLQLLRNAPESKRRAVVDAWLQRNPKAAANMQRMVDEAAKAAGYDVGPVYHGTKGKKKGVFPFTVFDTSRQGQNTTETQHPPGSYFAENIRYAEGAAMSQTNMGRSGKPVVGRFYLRSDVKRTPGVETAVEYLATDPSQIKSADPITYDDAGNIIPLSQRFQETSPDIRYALGTGGSDTILSGTYPQPKLKVSDQKPPKIIADIEFDKIDKDNKYTGTALLYESVDFKDKFIPWAYDTMTPELAEWTAANANNKEAIYARMGIGNVRSDAPLAVFYAAASLKAPSFAAKAVLADAHKNLITDVAQTLAVQGVAQYSKELGAFYAEQSVMDLMRKYRDRVLNENLGKEGSAESVAPKIQEAAKVAGDVVNDAVESIDSEIELAVAATEDPKIKGLLTNLFNGLVKKARILKRLASLRAKKAIGTGSEMDAFDAELEAMSEEQLLKMLSDQEKEIADITVELDKAMNSRPKKAKPTDEQMASEGEKRARAIISRIKASSKGKTAKERSAEAKAVDALYAKHLKSPMTEQEFLKGAEGILEEKTAKRLYAESLVDIANKELRSSKQSPKKASRSMDDPVDPDTLAKELMKADATRLKGTEKEGKIPKFDSIEKLYNLAKKQGEQDRTAFVKAMMDFGVSEENANALFGYAQMYRESQTPGRKSGGTVSSVFSSQVKSPEPYQAFKDKLKKFNVRPSVVDALFAAARNETTLRQKDAIEARKRDLVNLDTGDMMRLVSRLRSKLGNINWASVFNQSQAMQGTLQERIADAVEQELQNQSPQIKKIQDRIDALETGDPNIPELQKQIEDLRKTIKPLSEAERKAIGAAVADVFERAQKGYLDGVMKRIADSPRIKAEAAEKLKNALPKLIRAYNNGLLGREEYHNIMAQEFGLKEFSQATFDKARKIVSDIQETNSPTVRRQKTFELAELVQKNADVPLAEILQSFWVISVLTGVRTHFAMFTAALNGFRAVFQSAVDAAVFKRSPGAAIKSIRAFVKAFFRGIHEVMVYTFNAEPTMIDSFEQSQNVFLDGMQGSKLFSAAERLVMKGGKGKVFGSYMAFFERLMRAWDHITSTSTVAGLRETAAILNPEIYNAALKPSEADIKATEKFVADAHWNGTRPTGAVDKIIFDSQVRQNIDQIYIERLKAEKQALIDSGALAEAKNKQDDIQSYQRFIDDVRAVGSSAAYQEDPKGVGGFIYTRLKGFTGGLGVASKAKLEASMKEFQMNKADMDLRDNVTERIKLGVLWTQYLAATMARPILGLQFVRFVGNRLNEIISFTPGLGLLRASFEEQFQGGKNAALKRLIVQNQVVGTALAIAGYYALKALKDEPDEEKRGWSISGSWGNLTPDRKSQLMSAGKSPFALTIWINGKPVNLSYNDWPIASILATVGSINDIRSYTPDRWAEKSDTDHLFSAIWAGSSSFMDMSALSGFMDSIGSSAYSTEPDTAFIQKLNKTAANFAGGFIPRFLKDIDFMISEEANRVSSSDLFGRWAKELPFYRRNVGEPMIDILGNQVKTPRTPWSRAIKLGPEDDAYKLLGALNSRGLWLGGVNAANRRIGYGNKRRELTADEALTFEVEAGKLYREILKRHGERLIKMPYAAAKDMISKLTKTARDRAFNKVRQMAARG